MGEKILCFAAYIFGFPGAIFVRFAGKKNSFCLHHVRRSIELFLFMTFLLIAWYILAHILFLIPYGGFPLAMAVFGIVVAAAIFSLILFVMGIVKAFQRKTIIFPFVSSLMSRIEPVFKFFGLPEE